MLTRNRLYSVLGLFWMTGVAWLMMRSVHPHPDVTLCLFRQVTGAPCPSCGTTRAMEAFLRGSFVEAVLLNPLVVPAIMLMCIIPCWLAVDLFRRDNSLLRTWIRTEQFIRQPLVTILLGSAILLIWYCNVKKGL